MANGGGARPPAGVGVDGSDQSVAALRWAVRYGAATGTPVRAVLAWHYPTAAGQPPVGRTPEPVEKEVEGHEVAILREPIGKAAADAPGPDVHGEVAHGHPVEAPIAESGPAAVVGRGGGGGCRGRPLGSGSLRCVNAAQWPVGVVHSHGDGWPSHQVGSAAAAAPAIAVSEFGTSRASWRLRSGPPKNLRSTVLR